METVTKCVKSKDWTKDGRTVPIYQVELSDGRAGESFGKEIPIGTPVSDLLIWADQYGNKIKLKSASGGFAKQRAGNESFALSYAKDIYIAHLTTLGKEMSSDLMFKLADKMFDWLEAKKK